MKFKRFAADLRLQSGCCIHSDSREYLFNFDSDDAVVPVARTGRSDLRIPIPRPFYIPPELQVNREGSFSRMPI